MRAAVTSALGQHAPAPARLGKDFIIVERMQVALTFHKPRTPMLVL